MARDLASILKATIAALLVCISLVALQRYNYGVTADVGFVALVSTFVVVFALTSNRLRQVSAPGGFSAEFQEAAKAAVESRPIASPGEADGEDIIMVSKRGLEELQDLAQRLNERDFVALRLRMGSRSSRYDPHQVAEYVRTLSAITRNMWVIIIDQRDRFVAAVEANALLRLPEHSLADMVFAIQSGDAWRINRLPLVTRVSAPVGVNNREALRLMSQNRLEFLVLVDQEGVPKRIATRGQIVEQLLLALAR